MAGKSCTLLPRERVVYAPTVVPCSSSVTAPLAQPEDFAMSAVSLNKAPGSLDSGRGTIAGADTMDLSSEYSAKTSGLDSMSEGSFEGASVAARFGTSPPGASTVSDQFCSLENDEIDARPRPLVDVPVNLAFRELSYSVQTRVRLKRVPRRILHSVSGEFRAGQLTAIMGPSGAGKSSLMDVLSGYTFWGVSGRLLVNGSPRDAHHFRRQSVYIQQDAALHPQLTVKEAITMAAALKLGTSAPNVQETMARTLESLGLSEHQGTMTARLSGGQMKRLAIALELLSNPPVMFFDEPTSGLDSSSTKQCVSLLQGLARQGRTIVCTIHQPSATVFELLDQLFLLVDGRCAYRGASASLLPYLARLGLTCPPYHNPADYALEVAGGEYGDHADALVEASDNGRCDNWTGVPGHLRHNAAAPATPPDEPATPTTASTACWPQWACTAQNLADNSGASISNTSSSSSSTLDKTFGCCCSIRSRSWLCGSRVYPTTFWMQLYILVKRTFIRAVRDKMLAHSRLYTHLGAGLLIGVLFLDIGGDAAHVFHNFSLLFFCLMFLMFTALSAMVLAFPLEMPIIAREHFNRWYSLKCYYLAVTIADAPLQLLCTLAYTVLVYYMSAQPMEPTRFFLFLFMCSLVSFVAQGVGLIVGAGMKVEHGVIFGPLAILPFTIFSGYFVHMKDAPAGMRWLFHASYLKYGLEGVMLAVYGYDRERMACSESYCHFRIPDKFLKELDLADGDYWLDASVLACIGIVLRIGAYFVLKFRLKQFR